MRKNDHQQRTATATTKTKNDVVYDNGDVGNDGDGNNIERHKIKATSPIIRLTTSVQPAASVVTINNSTTAVYIHKLTTATTATAPAPRKLKSKLITP